MEPTVLVAAVLAIVAALLLFSLMTLLGAWLVRIMRLPLDLPAEVKLAPPAPPFAERHTVEEARAIAARQARLAVIHRHAYDAAVYAERTSEIAVLAKGSKVATLVQAAAGRARTAAEAAEKSRSLPSEDEAGPATARQLELAQAAFQEAAASFAVPKPSTLRYWLLGALMLVLVVMWVALFVMRSHAAAAIAAS